MDSLSTDLKGLIADRIAATPVAVWTPVDFLDLGSRDAVDKALQRLVATSGLRRIDRGLYDAPRFNQLTGKPSVPDYRRIIDAVARRDQARVLIDGMTAANELGLSDAVPGQIVVHVDARLRPIRIGAQTIVFRPTAPSKLFWAGRPAMRVVQALHWLRPLLSKPEDRQRVMRQLRAILQTPGAGEAIAADLRQGLSTLPAWMQDHVRDLLADTGGAPVGKASRPPPDEPEQVKPASNPVDAPGEARAARSAARDMGRRRARPTMDRLEGPR